MRGARADSPNFPFSRQPCTRICLLSSLLGPLGKPAAGTTSGVNARLTLAAKSPGSPTMGETRSSPDASAFRSLFASASQCGGEEKSGPDASAVVAKDAKGSVPDKPGKKAPGQSKGQDGSGGLLNAVAGALAAGPGSAPLTESDAALSDGEGVAPANASGLLSQFTGSYPVPSAARNSGSFAAKQAPTMAAAGQLPGSADLPLSTDTLGLAAGPSKDKAAEPAAADSHRSQGPAAEIVDDLSRSGAQNTTRAGVDAARPASHEKPASLHFHSESEAMPGMEREAATISTGSSVTMTGQSTSLAVEAMAVIRQAMRPSASMATAPSHEVESKTGLAVRKDCTSPVAESPSAAGAAHSKVTVQAADRDSFAQRRATTFDDAKENGLESQAFAGTTRGAPSSEAVMQAPSQALAAAGAPPAPSSPVATQHSAPSLSPAKVTPTPASPALQTAQVLQRMDKAEIRIGLQTTEFGAIRLHTTVANDQVGAAVSTSHPALRDALLNEAAWLEKAMARHSLRLDSVSVGAGAANSNFNSFGGNEREQPRASPCSMPPWLGARPHPVHSAMAASGAMEHNYRLDVRA